MAAKSGNSNGSEVTEISFFFSLLFPRLLRYKTNISDHSEGIKDKNSK